MCGRLVWRWGWAGLFGSVSLFASPPPPRPLDELAFVSVGDADSIPDGVVSALADDRSGLMWIGTPAGLVRYDGYRFRMHVHDLRQPGSIGGNFVRSLLRTRDGRIWVGTEADGLSVYDPASETFRVFQHDRAHVDGITSGAITALAEDARGAIWIATRGGGLDRLDPLTLKFQHHRVGDGRSGLDDDRVQSLLVDRNGTLWVGTWSGLARKAENAARMEPLAAADAKQAGLAGKTIWCLFEAADGQLWVGTQQGDLAVVNAVTGAALSVGQPMPDDRTSAIYAAVQPVPGEVWVARASGIEVRDAANGHLMMHLRHDPARASSIGSNEVRAMFVDRANLVWVGGYGGGLQRHDPRRRSLRVRRQGDGHGNVFEDPNVRSVLELQDGRIVAGTQENGVAVFDRDLRLIDGFPPSPGEPGALQGGRVTGLAQTADGLLWLGTDSGLYRHDVASRHFERFRFGSGLTRCLLVGSDGDLWIGTDDGLYRKRVAHDTIERLHGVDGEVISGDINALAEDASGRVWVGTERGLDVVAPGTNVLISVVSPAHSGLAHPTILGLLIDRQRHLWVDTPVGLHRLRALTPERAEFEQISERLGIGGQPFGANLLEDGSGRIWTHQFVYDESAGEVHELTRADGVDIGTGWFRAYAPTRDGRLLFGGSKGLLVVDPAGYSPWTYAPPLVATELKVDGRSLPASAPRDALLLAPEQRGFSIEFSALDLSAPERNRYAYKLDGFDRDWISTDADYRVATYSNLWPGDYVMRVRGSNRNSVFSPHELALPVRVLPAFWQTWWFALLLAFALLASISSGIRLRTARIRRQARELQELVDGRTAELRASKEHAEAALTELQGTQRQLVEAEKMASLGGLVAGIAHEINTPIGIAVTAATHLQESSRVLVARIDAKELKASELPLFRDNVNESMRLILGSLERALHLITSFKKVAVDQSSEQRRRFELRGFLEDVRTALRPSYKATPHELLVECGEGIVVDTYPGALFQIMTNLINNSLIHAYSEGQSGQMTIAAMRDGDLLVLRYRDDGQGMPETVAARAFEPFFTTRRGSGGSGLGLHVVFNLVTQMLAGRIELNTAPGQGCEFVMRVPLSAPDRPPRV